MEIKEQSCGKHSLLSGSKAAALGKEILWLMAGDNEAGDDSDFSGDDCDDCDH